MGTSGGGFGGGGGLGLLSSLLGILGTGGGMMAPGGNPNFGPAPFGPIAPGGGGGGSAFPGSNVSGQLPSLPQGGAGRTTQPIARSAPNEGGAPGLPAAGAFPPFQGSSPLNPLLGMLFGGLGGNQQFYMPNNNMPGVNPLPGGGSGNIGSLLLQVLGGRPGPQPPVPAAPPTPAPQQPQRPGYGGGGGRYGGRFFDM